MVQHEKTLPRSEIHGLQELGGRGITVCPEWLDFIRFFDWAISNGYREDLTLDRINNNGNYDPDNCRWATRKEQARNSRSNRQILFNGKIKTLAEWAEERAKILGTKSGTLRSRLHRDWSIERAFNTPVGPQAGETKLLIQRR